MAGGLKQQWTVLFMRLTKIEYKFNLIIPSNSDVGAQLRNQPILRWAIGQLRIRSWVAHLKIGLAHLKMGWDRPAQLRIIQSNKFYKANFI